jgi:hypothetical protein
MLRMWLSLFNHLQDIHSWDDPDGSSRECRHEELDSEQRTWKNWLKAGEIQQLKKVFFDYKCYSTNF